MSWKFPKGMMAYLSRITPAIFADLGNLRSLIGCLVTLESFINHKFNNLASTPCKLETELTLPFLTNLKISLAAIIFLLLVSTPMD